MSIDRAVGGMEQYLLKLDTNETYNRLRFKASQWLHDKGLLNDDVERVYCVLIMLLSQP